MNYGSLVLTINGSSEEGTDRDRPIWNKVRGYAVRFDGSRARESTMGEEIGSFTLLCTQFALKSTLTLAGKL